MKLHTLLAAAALGLAATTGAWAQQPVAAPIPAFDLQGHRGIRGLAPENTLESFRKALATGVNTLELDIAITKDGVLVISHDRALNPDVTRGPDGKYLEGKRPVIHELTYAELQRYDVGRLRAGSKYAAEFPEQVPVDGARIPRLSDLFELVRRSGNDQVRFAIETKLSPAAAQETPGPEAFARAVIAAIREGGMQHRSSVLSFDWRTLKVVQKEAPEIPTVYLTAAFNISKFPGDVSPWNAGHRLSDHGNSVPRMIKEAGGHTWSSNFNDLTPALVKEAQGLGLKVLAWTVNTPDLMAKMMDMGVDGIVTDRADILREEMRKRGMPLPAPVAPR